MPPVTQALLITNVIVFLAQMSSGLPLVEWFALWPDSNFEIWQLVTYSFLHGSLTHIFFNMFGLYMFGSAVERLFGPRFYLAYYLVSVVVAAVSNLLITHLLGASGNPVIGASGGLFGLLLAFAWYFPQQRILLIFAPVPIPARIFVAGYAVIELFLGVTGTAAGVAHFAHLGGMLGGYLMIEYRRRFSRR